MFRASQAADAARTVSPASTPLTTTVEQTLRRQTHERAHGGARGGRVEHHPLQAFGNAGVVRHMRVSACLEFTNRNLVHIITTDGVAPAAASAFAAAAAFASAFASSAPPLPSAARPRREPASPHRQRRTLQSAPSPSIRRTRRPPRSRRGSEGRPSHAQPASRRSRSASLRAG